MGLKTVSGVWACAPEEGQSTPGALRARLTQLPACGPGVLRPCSGSSLPSQPAQPNPLDPRATRCSGSTALTKPRCFWSPGASLWCHQPHHAPPWDWATLASLRSARPRGAPRTAAVGVVTTCRGETGTGRPPEEPLPSASSATSSARRGAGAWALSSPQELGGSGVPHLHQQLRAPAREGPGAQHHHSSRKPRPPRPEPRRRCSIFPKTTTCRRGKQ